MAIACALCLIFVRIFARSRRKGDDQDLEQTPIIDHAETKNNDQIIFTATETNLSGHLTDIMRLASNIAQTAPNGDLRKKNIMILRSAYNAKRALNNFSAIQKVDSGRLAVDKQAKSFKPNIELLVKKIRASLGQRQVELTHHVDPKLPECIFLDHAMLIQMIENIMDHSVKVTKTGRIHLHITGDQKRDNQWNLNIVLADTGTGLSPETLTAITNPESFAGSALNDQTLSYIASAKMAKLMEGTLGVMSTKGRGTEVTISLPMRAANVLAEETMDIPKRASLAKTGRLSGMRVLVVEDDSSSQNVLQTFLEPEGCVVHCIPDGEEAMKTLMAEPAFDVIFMDVRMPGLNGIETTKLIRKSGQSFAKIPIIAITADTSSETNATAMMAGMDLFLNKPVSAKGLFGGINFVLDLQSNSKTAAQ